MSPTLLLFSIAQLQGLKRNMIDIAKEFGLSTGRNISREYTQDYVPVEYIKDGVLILNANSGGKRKRYVKVIKVIPINFALKTPDEQDMTIVDFAKWLKSSAPSSLQIKVTTEKTDIEAYLAQTKTAIENEQSPKCRNTMKNYVAYLEKEGRFETFERNYFMIFEYEPSRFGQVAKTEEDVIISLNNRAEQIKTELHGLGNDVITYTTQEENIDLAELIYNHYNRRTHLSEPFGSRIQRIEQDSLKVNGLTQEDDLVVQDIRSILAPKSIDTELSPDYMVVDGMYRGFFYIKANSYPSTMQTLGGWLHGVINFGYGYDADIFFIKGDASKKLMSIRNHSKWATYGLNNTEAEQIDYDAKMDNYRGTMYMKTALTAWKEDIYDMAVIVTIHAFTKQEFYERKALMMEAAVKLDIEFGECKRFQEEGFFANGFYNDLSPKLFNLSHRNLTTSGVSASYPFTSYALSDPQGVALGFHRQNHSLVVYDPFDASKYPNANIAIYGATGHGKTYTLLTLITRLRCQGIQNFVLSPDKQDEFRRVVDAVDGEFIDLSTSSPHRINMFDILPMSSPEERFLGGESYVEKSWLIDKVDNLKIWFKYIVNDLTTAELSILEKTLMRMYEDFGITPDNNSIYKNSEKTELKEMPIMQDFYDRISSIPNLREDISIIFEKFINGAARNMNGHTNVDLNNLFIVFGMENIDESLLSPTLFMILEYVWAKCRQNRTVKKMISIDEGWQLLNGQDQQVGAFVEHIFKVIRGYGGGALFATQSIADLFQNEHNYGNAILSCSNSKIILGMQKKDLDMISSELGLSAYEASSIISSDTGEALLCAGNNHIPIKVKASEYEHNLFTTRRSDLERMARQRR